MHYQIYDFYNTAEACYLNATRLNPSSPKWAALLGSLYWRTKDHERSAKWLRRARALDFLAARQS